MRPLGFLVAALLSACSLTPIHTPNGEPAAPLSRLTIDNRLEAAAYLRATWTDGMESVAEIPPGRPLYFSGSIGGGMPASLEVLDARCAIIDRMAGIPWDIHAKLIITPDSFYLEPITRGDSTWRVADSTDECRTKPEP